MLRTTALLLLSLFSMAAWTIHATAEVHPYAVQSLDSSFISNASAVYRNIHTRFEVEKHFRAVKYFTRVVTVFNSEGRSHGELTIHYDRFTRVVDLDGALYDATGEKIRSLGSDDIQDYSAISNYTLYEDARVRTAQLYHDTYPYTVELNYELAYDGYLSWPTWYAQPTSMPVSLSSFEVLTPSDSLLRWWANSDTLSPVITAGGSRTTYTWTARNLRKIPDELKEEEWEDITAIVRIAPGEFLVDDYQGSFASWQTFGRWYFDLASDRNVLPDPARKEVRLLLAGIVDEKEKVAAVYRYLQSRTRYVSIQLGIGGWQPFGATYVHERGYGDCKALSNYMVSLLNESGIAGYTVLIKNGNFAHRLITEFPSNQFNHAIVCVPLQQDTVWLECTSQSMPFGRVGRSNENRDALMITPGGGVIVRVPASSSDENFQQRVTHVTIGSQGSAEASVSTTVGGNQQDYLRSVFTDATPIDRERWILDHVNHPNTRIIKYVVDGMETKEPQLSLFLQLLLPRFASTSGTRIFFNPNLMERQTYVPPENRAKVSPVKFGYPYSDKDSIVYRIPQNFRAEALPPLVNLNAPFGTFTSRTVTVGDSLVVFTRALDITARQVPPEGYAEYRTFFTNVVKADRGQVVLVKR